MAFRRVERATTWPELEQEIGHGLGSWMTEFERDFIVAEALRCNETDCLVEIGCFSGGVTAALAYASGGHVVAIDPFTNDTPVSIPNHEERCSLSECFHWYLKHREIEDRVEVLEAPSQVVGLAWADRTVWRDIRLILIDGDHHYDAVKEDLRCFAPWVVVGGMLIADDYNDVPNVGRAVDEYMAAEPPGRWEIVYAYTGDSQVAKMQAYRRVA